jgi:asparagine synthase (glutamine-hydrolysing)
MCGILGTIPATNEFEFNNALNKLAHRGPDGYGIWTSDNNDITLGHRRLSILDLSNAGKQPMHYNNGRYTLTFNGEIYNYIELRDHLKKDGFIFKTNTDSEVILAYFMKYGINCVNKFNGMWSFAIWDEIEKTLYMSRDRFGKKPLFYYNSEKEKQKFVFASEMKAIYPFLTEFKLSNDFNWIKNNLFFYESTKKCLIEGIKRFPAGHNGILKNGKLTLERYWNTLDHIQKNNDSYETQIETFSSIFEDACKIRLRADVTCGSALSGGLDSSSITAYISKIFKDDVNAKNKPRAFIATFPKTQIDETYFAKKVTDHLNINATFCEIDPLKSVTSLEESLYYFEELYITSPIPMMEVYSKIKQSGITVSIDGHGADELLCGYNETILNSIFDSFNSKNSINEIFKAYSNINPSLNQREIKSKVFKYFFKESIKKLLNIGYKSRDFSHKNFIKFDSLNKELYILTHETILPTLLRNYDRYSMFAGVEIRMPFLDHRLVEFLFSIPYTSKIKNGYTKSILRSAVNSMLPNEVVYRKDKIGFNSPMTEWIRGPLKEYFFDEMSSTSFRNSSTIDQNEVRKVFINLINQKSPKYIDGQKAWTSIMPYLWEKSTFKFK